MGKPVQLKHIEKKLYILAHHRRRFINISSPKAAKDFKLKTSYSRIMGLQYFNSAYELLCNLIVIFSVFE